MVDWKKSFSGWISRSDGYDNSANGKDLTYEQQKDLIKDKKDMIQTVKGDKPFKAAKAPKIIKMGWNDKGDFIKHFDDGKCRWLPEGETNKNRLKSCDISEKPITKEKK